MKKTFKKLSAFTLAEVMITLLIIGVVSSLVIPAIVNDTQDAELKAAWKKKYSELEQASRLLIIDNGGSLKNLCSGSYDCFTNIFKNYLSYSKTCSNAKNEGCWHMGNEWYFLNGSPATILDNSAINGRNISRVAVVLNDGSFLFSVWFGIDCSWTQYPNSCGHISVDINGFKGPNIVGKDIYAVYVTDTKIVPVGVSGTFYAGHTNCAGATNGYGCAKARLMD
jgi:prepilin-type N-terminal cleavage/methylation domain-containing protein